MRASLFWLAVPLLAGSLFATEPGVMTLSQAVTNHALLAAAIPKATYQLRRIGATRGSGIFDLTFDYESGELREIHMEQSTGRTKLDAAMIAAFKKWKAKPRAIHTLRVQMAIDL